MLGGILGIIGLISVHFLVKWYDDKNIDSGSMTLTGSSTESEVNDATEKRKSEKRSKLEAEVQRLNEQHPDRLFYRDGPRVKEHVPEKVAAIRECERLNAPYRQGYPHYVIERGRIEYAESLVNKYKYRAKAIELNNDPKNRIHCDFDHMNMKLINNITGEDIPFDPDGYTLPPSYFS